ncbi:MAG: MotA/TolQ/ExbB proton channel family protein [Candidatus Zixiibacteriota bacterium]
MFKPVLILSFAYGGPFKGTLFELVAEMGLFAKIILIILFFLSVASWAVTFNKIRLFRKVNRETQKFLSIFRIVGNIAEIYLSCVKMRRTPLSKMLEAGYKELMELSKVERNPHTRVSASPEFDAQVVSEKDKFDVIRMALERVGAEEVNRLEKALVFLATTGNISPFFGLLGTVWGIMDAFASIGVRGSATLAIVAPGIAEALIATIVGLAVAIPAVMAYNFFNNKLKIISTQVDNFALEFLSTVKKENIL